MDDTMNIKHLLMTAALPAAFIVSPATAQVVISEDQTDPIVTSIAGGDVTINTGVTVNPVSGAIITVDSDNSVSSAGTLSISDSDNATGVDLQGGNSGDFTMTGGSIQLLEDYTPIDEDNDGVVDGAFAQGTGRTGILISGASPFAGNVTVENTASISIEGNDSFGLRIEDSAGLTGNINLQGVMNIVGSSSRAVSLEGDLIGNLTNTGSMNLRGEGASAIVSSGTVTGQINNSGTIVNSGYRFSDRPSIAGRGLLNPDDRLQAGSAMQINGDVSNGVFLQRVITTTTDADGNSTSVVTSTSNITQQGSAAAVLIDGQGTPIAIGIVATITDVNDADFDAAEQYAFVNQGTLTATGVYDDVNATAFEVRDAALANGINNAGNLVATTFRSGLDAEADAAGATGLARVIVFGDGAIADAINNSGLIIASVTEAADEVYADRDNIIGARDLQAVAIDIGANAQLSRIVNSSGITAVLTGRSGEAIAIRDASGTLTSIENSGNINALGTTSDAQGFESTNFNLIAIDLSVNTSGVTLSQIAQIDEDTTDDVVPALPSINGDILLGGGDDMVTVSAGSVTGALSFGGGADSFTLSGESVFTGALTDSDGLLTLDVSGGSSLIQTATSPLNVTTASFDATSIFRPTLDGSTGEASGIISTGDITFADGATIAPLLNNVINTASTTFTVLDAGGTLTVGSDLGSLSSLQSPFMYDTTFAIDPNDSNALIITLDLRSTDALGLDRVQASSFGTAFNAMQNNAALANAFTNITDGAEFNSALNQLLPEFASASRQFVVANVDGAVGAVGTHLDNARRSQDKPGGVWIQEFAYFADRELSGLSEQYRGNGFGITGGVDTALGPLHTVGINFGFATTEIEDVGGVDDPLDVLTLQLGSYAGYSTGNLGVEAYAGIGFNDFEATRNIQVGTFSDSAQGDWSGTHFNGSLRAGYDIDIGEKFWIRPAASLDYLRLKENAYTETGPTGIALDVDERTSSLGGVTAMLNFGAKLQGKRTWLRPALRVGYRNDFINDGVVTNYRFAGLTNEATLTGTEFPSSGILVGFSLAAGSQYSSLGLDLDSDIRDGFIRHTGRIVLRLIF